MPGAKPGAEDVRRLLQERAPELLDREDGHWYRSPSGATYPSISTVLSATRSDAKMQSLESWRKREPASEHIMQQAQEIGTQTHKIIERYMGGSLDFDGFDLMPVAHFNNLLPLLQNVSNVICAEQRMHSDAMRVAGTCDLIADYGGVLSVIDYKTKRTPQRDEYLSEYYAQTACYAEMFKEITGMAVDQLVILVSSEKNTRQEFVKPAGEYRGVMLGRIDRYYMNGG